jgi:hypothetical protein
MIAQLACRVISRGRQVVATTQHGLAGMAGLCRSRRATRDQAARQLAQAEEQLANLEAAMKPTEVAQAEANLTDARSTLERARADLQRDEAPLRTGYATA